MKKDLKFEKKKKNTTGHKHTSRSNMPGDDWEDDYTPDNLIAGSGDEIDGPFIPLEDEEKNSPASDDVNSDIDVAPTKPEGTQDSAKKAKRRKQRSKNNERKAKASCLSHIITFSKSD